MFNTYFDVCALANLNVSTWAAACSIKMIIAMTPKERVLAVLNRQPVDRLPVDLWHTPEVAAALRSHFKVADDFAMWRALGLDKIVWDFMDYHTEAGERAGGHSGAGAEAGGSRTMWGAPLRDIQAGEAHYAEFGVAPMIDCQTPADIENYAWWPDVDRFDYDAAVSLAQRASPDYAVIGPWVSCFEVYIQLRGLEQSSGSSLWCQAGNRRWHRGHGRTPQ
jgi:uroporphyrinogen decarboxylase